MKYKSCAAILLILIVLLTACAPKEEEVFDNPGGAFVQGDADLTEPSDAETQPETENETESSPTDTPQTEQEEKPSQPSDEPITDDTEAEDPDSSVSSPPLKDNTIVDIETDLRWFGRTYATSGTHYFNWTESGFVFTFNGTGAEATFESNAPGGKNTPYIKIYVDGRAGKSVAITDSMQTVTLCEKLKKGTHTVRVVKRTNARSSSVGLMEITLYKNGTIEAPPAPKERRIEFVGDSITVGYGVLGNSSTTEWSTETEDGSLTYAALTGKALNAEYNVIAISGRGLAHNTGGDTDQLMPYLYTRLDDYNKKDASWDFSKFAPDVVVINLATNDHKTSSPQEVTAATMSFLQTVRKQNKNAYIIVAYGLMGTTMESALKNAISGAGDSKISFLSLPMATDKVLGHPAKSAHEKAAKLLEAEIRRLTGWTD